MRRTGLLLSVFLLFLLMTPAVQAQDIVPIVYGDSVRGRIDDPDQGVLYFFDAQAGDSVTITAESDSIDVYLRLADSDGELLAENDDVSGNNVNARIVFDVPASGQYIIAVLGYDAGPYILSLDALGVSGGGGSSEPASDGSVLNYGDSISGQAFSMDKPVTYIFSGEANDPVTISASSDSVDTYLVLADASGNTLAENDDISGNDVNSQISYTLPANGEYLIGVFAYEAGPFTLLLESGTGGATQPVSDVAGVGEVVTGRISDDPYFIEIPIEGVREGQTITVDARATSGDLDLYIGLFFGPDVVAENDDRDPNTTDSYIEYPGAAEGDYTLIVTRYGYDKGETSGSFEVSFKVGGGSALASSGSTLSSNPTVAGYPVLDSSAQAEWTVLVYMGGDNNLEDGLINDIDEFERAGGSTDDVRIVALLDRSGEYDRSNGNWTETRLFEIGRDRSRDFTSTYPPTIDTQALGALGEIDTGYGKNLLDFLVWGVTNFPAKRYAVILNDHGGAWYGTVTDDTTGQSILNLPELQQVFSSALQNTGLSRFDLLINDACLMSGIEHYAAMSAFFDFAIASPEITLNPSFDMELMTNVLNRQPDIEISQLGQLLNDKYLKDMQELAPDTAPVLGASTTDLRNFSVVTEAIDAFASVVESNPRAYASLMGQVRANTYTYSFFLPETEFGPATNIDVGNFMFRLANESNDAQLTEAATNVLAALREVQLYGIAGSQLESNTTYYNIYFPARSSDFDAGYFEQNPVRSWSEMLRAYFGAVRPGTRAFNPAAGTASAGVGAPPLAPSLVPVVSITNVFPPTTSINVPVKVSMEVTGRNITRGIFTVDRVEADGSIVRLQTSPIVTEVVEEGVVNFINLWNPGVDDSNFNWDALLPVVTDGQTTSFEQVVSSDDQDSIAGRYHYPGDPNWVEVTVMFDDDGQTANVVSKHPGSSALASIRLEAGGEFQTYRSLVTPDGRVELQPGTTFIWPEDGISWRYEPAPSGDYRLGFLVEAAGGSTGFGSAAVTVDNEEAITDLRGYLDSDWGFVMQRPSEWFDVSYFPDSDFLQTSDRDSSAYLFVYPVYDAGSADLEAIAQAVLDKYDLKAEDGFTPITVDDRDALEFTFSYTNDIGDYVSRAFSVYLEDLDLGLVFSSEALDSDEMERNYALFTDYLFFFDVTQMTDADTGVWTKDTYGDNVRYPVPETWMPGFENGLWWTYTPDGSEDSLVFASVTVLNPLDEDAEGVLETLLDQEVEALSSYTILEKDTYYAELNTWAVATFTREVGGQTVLGRLYTTVKEDGTPYALWFEVPQADFEALFRDQFTVILDGFRIDTPDESAS